MNQKQHTVNQVILKLRRAEVLFGKGVKLPEFCKQLENTELTYYCWRQKYSGVPPAMVK